MPTENNLSFEEMIAELEKITKSLEGGTATLDESLSLYERGIKAVKHCNKLLDSAEKRVKILGRGDDGEISETDFSAEDK